VRLAFALASALIAWTYAVFPLATLLRGWLRPRPVAAGAFLPDVTVIAAAHDEEASIGPRVANLLALDYPADRLELVVASDGSADRTVENARSAGPQVVVLDLPRVGKAAALEAAVDASRGSILVFTDANSAFDPGAIRALVRPFADPSVGGVAGNQVYLPAAGPEGSAPGERGYWTIDRALKEAEAAAGSVVSATGGIYAIRRELFSPIPEGLTDDFHETLAVVAHGRRFVFAPGAIAWEPVAPSSRLEYGRKVRVMVRGLRCVAHWRPLLSPARTGWFGLALFTRKVLMRTMAAPLLVLLGSSVALGRRSRLHAAVAVGGVSILGLGAAGLVAEHRDKPVPRLFALPAYFCLVQVASLHATWLLLRGRRIDRWRPSRDVAAGGRAIDVRPAALVGRVTVAAMPADEGAVPAGTAPASRGAGAAAAPLAARLEP
jgi:glycosyltransferase involved in cell wall biosynthesis